MGIVSWQSGIHIVGTQIWCDAVATRDVCFVSGAHPVSAVHGQLIAHPTTLSLVPPGRMRASGHLAVPYGRPFTLGNQRLELIRSGHCIGGASLLIEGKTSRTLYAGTINPNGVGLGGAADLRSCDALVIDTTYGAPRFDFPDQATAVLDLIGFVNDIVQAGGVPILFTHSIRKGLDVLAALRDQNLRLVAHRKVHAAAQILRDVADLPRCVRWSGQSKIGDVLVWLRESSLSRDSFPRSSRIALVSGETAVADAVGAAGADIGVAWSSCADYRGLCDYIKASRAQKVFITGRYAEVFADAPDLDGIDKTVLAPPRQMPLFAPV